VIYSPGMDDIQKRIEEIESQMSDVHFWDDKQRADDAMSELSILKSKLSKAEEGKKDYNEGNAVMTIFAGAGGTDAEDFVRILLDMYRGYIKSQGWTYTVEHEHETDRGGYRNITIEIEGKGAYGILRNESGVHRLVRISPFDADKQRHTSFAMVEVIPKFEKLGDINLPEDQLRIDFARSSGPGGQNVNKRETAVRITHIPTKISVHVDAERSQQQNRERAMQYLAGKLHRYIEDKRIEEFEGVYVSKDIENEWGSQIRSYVFHPYQQIKDHRTGVEEKNIEKVLEGDIQSFIDAEAHL